MPLMNPGLPKMTNYDVQTLKAGTLPFRLLIKSEVKASDFVVE